MWKLPFAMASMMPTSGGRGSYSTSTAAAASRQARIDRPTTIATTWAWYLISSSAKSGSSRPDPTLLCPGMSSVMRTATTPGIPRAAVASRRTILARACGEHTGQMSSMGLRCAVSSA